MGPPRRHPCSCSCTSVLFSTATQRPQKEVFTLVWNCFIGGKLRHNSQTCCQLEGSWWGDEDNDDVKGQHCDSTSGFGSYRIPIWNTIFAIKCRRSWGGIGWQTDRQQTNRFIQIFIIITFVGRFLQSALDVFLAPSTKYTSWGHEMKFNEKQNERSLRNHCRTQSLFLSSFSLMFFFYVKQTIFERKL